jgi:uncharacterized SAM-binding protein YcdF (DUF218 family)
MSILNPLTFFWLLLAVSLLIYKLNRKKTAKVIAILATAQLFLFSVTPLPVFMIQRLEQQYPVYKGSENEKLPIHVLGNGHADDPSLYPSQKLSFQALERTAEGIRIYNYLNHTRISFSGFAVNKKEPTGNVMAKAAVSLGVSPKDTILFPAPRNTWEEAVAYKKRFGTKNKFILVTNATHMPRAMEVFRSMGMQPIAAPTGFFLKKETGYRYNWWPSAAKMIYTEAAAYEYTAQLYYKWFKL